VVVKAITHFHQLIFRIIETIVVQLIKITFSGNIWFFDREKGYQMKKVSLLFLLAFILSACASTSPVVVPTEKPAENQPQPATAVPQATVVQQNAPAIDGATILENQCAACHSPDRAKQQRKTHDQWDQTVSRMIGKGAVLSDAEKKALVDYLTATYGK
jgi:cytochrome c5